MLTNPSFIRVRQPTTSPDFFLCLLKPFASAAFRPHHFSMHHYYLFHKPYQVLSQFSAEGDKITLAHYFKHLPKNIYPVGRLDYDSEGLLLLTDDKSLTQKLLLPSFAHPRTYWVQVEGAITNEALQQLQEGVTINIDGKQHHTKKAIAQILNDTTEIGPRNPPIRVRKNIPDTWISLTLTEGKNRQVRRMTAAVGFPTLRLIRHAIGKQTIAGILPGNFKELNEAEMRSLLA